MDKEEIKEDLKEFFERVFKEGALKRVFSIARFLTMWAGSGITTIYFWTGYNIWATIGFAVLTFILFRYGQIKGYLP